MICCKTAKDRSDGTINAEGLFEYYGNISNNIAEIKNDGTFEHSFDAGTGLNGGVTAVTVLNDKF
jgi:hypothetical protein